MSSNNKRDMEASEDDNEYDEDYKDEGRSRDALLRKIGMLHQRCIENKRIIKRLKMELRLSKSHARQTKLKECAQAEGVLAKLGVASESAADLSHGNRVPETVEYCEKVPRSSARPHIDLVPCGNGTGTRLTCADT
jgi:hypothetical protein